MQFLSSIEKLTMIDMALKIKGMNIIASLPRPGRIRHNYTFGKLVKYICS